MKRYAPTYRQDEIALICRLALRGESLCYVGVAGTGKTNLTNLLWQDPYGYKQRYLRAHTQRVHFVLVDIPIWDGQATHLWQLMLEELRAATAHLDVPAESDKTQTEQSPLSQLRSQIAWLSQQRDEHIIFLLDDVDKLLERGPLASVEQLYDLRNRNKNRLSYVLFCKRLPHLLGRSYGLDSVSKFYDLFSNHIYALGLYARADAVQMLHFLNQESDVQLDDESLNGILTLSGGHAGLIKTLFEHWIASWPAKGADLSQGLYENPDVERICTRVFRQLHQHEQDAAIRKAHGTHNTDDTHVIKLLARRGLLIEAEPQVWFSPLFYAYLRRQPRPGDLRSNTM